jgi:hypothetical protein
MKTARFVTFLFVEQIMAFRGLHTNIKSQRNTILSLPLTKRMIVPGVGGGPPACLTETLNPEPVGTPEPSPPLAALRARFSAGPSSTESGS